MNKALLAALASVALVGASCSVPDFAPVVLDECASISNAFGKADVLEIPHRAAPSGSSTLAVGSVFSSLWIGDPQGDNYTSGSTWEHVLDATGLVTGTKFYLVCTPTFHSYWNRVYVDKQPNAYERIANLANLYRDADNYLLFGGSSNLTSNRNATLYFTEPFVVTYLVSGNGHSDSDFRIPANDNYHLGYDDGRSDGPLPVLLQGVSSIEWSLYPDQGDSSSGSVVISDILNLFSSGLLDVQAFRSFCVGNSTGQFDFTFVYSSGNEKNILTAPVYVDVTSTSTSDVGSPLIPIVTAVKRNSGSALSDVVFTTFFYGSYSGNIIRYVNAESQNQERLDKVFNRLEISLPSNQSFVSLNYIGILDGYAQGYVDGVAASGAEIDDLTNRILELEQNLSQYQGKSYQVIYNLGYQAGLDAESQGAATFNSLFGNILSAPLTILNGLTDISFFGMPILTAILSLLMVAMALFLFKRFK